jgi:hypothetical protein
VKLLPAAELKAMMERSPIVRALVAHREAEINHWVSMLPGRGSRTWAEHLGYEITPKADALGRSILIPSVPKEMTSPSTSAPTSSTSSADPTRSASDGRST